MDERYSTQNLRTLRKLTRAVADILRTQMRDYLSTLSPLLRPKSLLGDFVQGGAKEGGQRSEKAWQELQALYAAVAGSGPFGFAKELHPPIEIASSTLEMTPLEYAYAAKASGETKTIAVTSPLKWIISYSGFGPARLREQLAKRKLADEDAKQTVLHCLLLHVILTHQKGVGQMLEALRFPISSVRLPEFGALPLICIGAPVATLRPPDEVLAESTEISGMNVFEEVVDLDAIANLRDPLKEQLVEAVKRQGAGA